MRKLFVILFLLLFCLPIQANDCRVTGKFEDIISNMNGIAEILSYADFSTKRKIDPDKCTFEIQDGSKGLYVCQVNATTALYISTDKYLNAEVLQIHSHTYTNVPTESSFDWAFVAANAACINMKMPDVQDMFIEAYKNGYYMDEDILMICNMHPTAENLWVFSVSNR